jgi:hypothetical protein
MKRLSGFAEACFDVNTIEQLRDALAGSDQELREDCAEWNLTASECRNAMQEAVSALEAEALQAQQSRRLREQH